MFAADTARAADTADVTALFQRLSDAWGAMDAEAYADAFTDDADYVTFVGTHLRGRRQIVDAHAALWEHFQKNTTLYGKIRSLRFVTADVAVMITEGAVLKHGKTAPKPADLKVQTLVAVRRPEGWRFSGFQNTKHRRLMEKIAAKKDARIAPEAR
ncbi:SgcJ/EcaC family oxidoreductase [Phytomonospora endophytica]|uniref:Uncharacterized protein (TIGR02246 family) n=1 Tax=Phytomonospora endophytica TaxID=714109 RepID=A0A841FYP7_9ACTN|nr:SgcJ/EcaC family oxidoreductase [Phytomonospora endophytica]MBB6037559.1 uncharacterized protein (TIGR02246 family) [Phytomonospora endophytica]GIG70260.1 hypothetical protein Pen01_65550 [Phytomonospora endophytica]